MKTIQHLIFCEFHRR